MTTDYLYAYAFSEAIVSVVFSISMPSHCIFFIVIYYALIE